MRYATVHATNAQVGKLIEGIDACERALSDLEAFRDADVQFHRALAEIPGNPIFVALHDTFVERLMKNRAVLPDFQERNAVSNQEHREIVSAILDKNPERAEEVLTLHLTRNFGTYFRLAMENKAAGTPQYSDPNQREIPHE